MMATDVRVLVGICTYNEAGNIVAMLEGLRRALPNADLLVVDDDSPDGTAQLAERWAENDRHTRVVLRRGQRGLGGAIQHAMKMAIEEDYRYFMNLDADLSHDPAELPSLLRCIEKSDEIGVVVGSRYLPGGEIVGWPWRRRLLSRMVNRFATGWLRLPVSDCSGSMRCYRVSALREIDLDQTRNQGYAWLEEILVRLRNVGVRMDEVPIRFCERRAGDSKLTLREALSSAWAISRLGRDLSEK